MQWCVIDCLVQDGQLMRGEYNKPDITNLEKCCFGFKTGQEMSDSLMRRRFED